MNLLLLAARNLLRNRRRSLTTLLAVIIGVMTILLFGGYSRDIKLGLQTFYVQGSGHLQVMRKDYFLYGSGNPAQYGITDYQRIINVIKKDPVLSPLVTVVTPTLQIGGIAGNFAAGVTRTVWVNGVVVDEQNRLREWNDYDNPMQLGPLALTGTGMDAAVVGFGVARTLQLCAELDVPDCAKQQGTDAHAEGPLQPDDITSLAAAEKQTQTPASGRRIEMLASSVHGAPNVVSLDVVKAENKGIKGLDDVYVAMHLPQAQQLVFGKDTPRVTSIIVQVQHTSQMEAARARLEELLASSLKGDDLEVLDYEVLNPFYGQAVVMFGTIFSFIAVLIGAIVLFTISNTMSMSVLERTVEIGTLRAIGLRRGGIGRLFICEGFLLGFIGVAIGVALSLSLAWVINHAGITWMPPGQATPVPLAVRVWGETALIFGTALGLTLVAGISAWLPARRAVQMNIVDALRYV
jgi:putative ABC transport system permease protein